MMRARVPRPLGRILGSVLALAALPGPMLAAEWPGWRGPTRDGHAAHLTTPESWPDTLHQVWRVEVGLGHASPLVAGERVFVHTQEGREEVVRGLSLDNGKTLWTVRDQVTGKPELTYGSHGTSPKATPALADGRLFTLSIDGTLRVRDTSTGELLWQRDGSGFKKRAPAWGTSTSPLIEDGRVIIHLGGDGHGALVALDAATGKEHWRFGSAGPTYASPVAAEIGGIRQVVAQTEEAIVGVDIASGRLLWSFDFRQSYYVQNVVTPVVDRGRVMLGGEGRGLFALAPRRAESAGTWEVVRLWHDQRFSLEMSSPIAVGESLCALASRDRGRLVCLDTKSGKVAWEGPPRGGAYANLVAVPGFLLALNDRAELRVFNSASWEEVVSYRVAKSPTWAHPAVLEDGFLIKDREGLVRWSLTKPPAASGSP